MGMPDKNNQQTNIKPGKPTPVTQPQEQEPAPIRRQIRAESINTKGWPEYALQALEQIEFDASKTLDRIQILGTKADSIQAMAEAITDLVQGLGVYLQAQVDELDLTIELSERQLRQIEEQMPALSEQVQQQRGLEAQLKAQEPDPITRKAPTEVQ